MKTPSWLSRFGSKRNAALMNKHLAVLGLVAAILVLPGLLRVPASYSAEAARQRTTTLGQRARDAGYHVMQVDSSLFFEFYVSRAPLQHEILSKADAELWEGVIWVIHCSEFVSIVGDRDWNGVVALGDAILIDEFEETCRPTD